MNIKAEKLKEYLAQKNITTLKVEEQSDENNENLRCVFHTYVKIYGQNLPVVVILDDSIYTIIRVQVIPDIQYMKNREAFINCINEMNVNYKAVKYYLNVDNALYLDMYIPSNTDDIDGDLLVSLLDAITTHLEKEYPNWMKLLWC